MFISVFFVAASNVFSQATDPKIFPLPNTIPKVVNNNGWKVPELRELVFVSQSEVKLGSRIVNRRTLRPRKEINAEYMNFFQNEEGLTVNIVPVLVRNVYEFKLGNRPFAFEVTYVPFTVDDYGIRRILGALMRRFYFDEDGDGKFETLYESSTMPETIPGWAADR